MPSIANLLLATLFVHQVERVFRVPQLLCGGYGPCQALGPRRRLPDVIDYFRELATRFPV